MARKRRSFFYNKKCTYCGQPATTFRLISEKHEMLCDRKECDFKSRLKAGWFTLDLFKEI